MRCHVAESSARLKKRSLRLSHTDSRRLVQLRERCDSMSVSAIVGLALTFLHQQLPLESDLLLALREQLDAEGSSNTTTVTSMTLQTGEEVALDEMTLLAVKPRLTANLLARLAILMLEATDAAVLERLKLMAPLRPRTGPRPKSLTALID